MDGILCINKPAGWTSFDVVAKMRGIAKTKKVGHSGTLDPMATGVLPLFFGKATKACDILPDESKGYLAEFQFGKTTDTLDITGTVLSEQESHVTRAELESVLPVFTGEIFQLPPMYSAVKVNGKRLYDLAREGKTVERKNREVTVHSLELLSFQEETQTAQIAVSCSKGTYIRTLCADIGERLEAGAVLTKLIRNHACGFSLKDCISLEEAQQTADSGQLAARLLPIEQLFFSYPEITLSEMQSKMFLNGVKLDLERLAGISGRQPETMYRVKNDRQQFLGLAYPDQMQMELRIKKIFVTN